MSCRLMKQLMPWEMIFSHFSRILAFSAASISATLGRKGHGQEDGYRRKAEG